MNEADRILADLQKKFPGTRVVFKHDSFLMKVINVVLMVITFGTMKTFMTHFITTIGRTIYVPGDWNRRLIHSRASTLRHEGIHIAQEEKLGKIRYKLTYLFWILPCVFALGRTRLEQEAYEETIRSRAEYYGVHSIRNSKFRDHIVRHFTSAEYFWMWPWTDDIERWFESVVKKIEKENDST